MGFGSVELETIGMGETQNIQRISFTRILAKIILSLPLAQKSKVYILLYGFGRPHDRLASLTVL